MKKIVVFGAGGMIGSALTNELNKNYDIIGVSRNPGKKLENCAETIDKPAALELIHSGVHGIANLAGASIAGSKWTDSYKKILTSSRVDFTGEISEAINRCENKPEFFLNASAVGYYGNSTENKDESSAPGRGFLAELTAEWEKAALLARESTRVILPRIGMVLSQTGGALEKMLLPYKFFIGGPLGSGRQFISWIHISDLIKSMIFAIENSDFRGVYNACSPNPENMKIFSRTLAEVLGRPNLFPVPEFVLKLLLGESATIVIEGQKAIPEKLNQYGFEFEYPGLKEALRNLLD